MNKETKILLGAAATVAAVSLIVYWVNYNKTKNGTPVAATIDPNSYWIVPTGNVDSNGKIIPPYQQIVSGAQYSQGISSGMYSQGMGAWYGNDLASAQQGLTKQEAQIAQSLK